MKKVWNIKKYDEKYIEKIVEKYKITEIMAKFLVARQIEDIDMFLNGNLTYLKDPYLIKDMDKFVERVYHAIKNKERICIYGDYDVDGITSITVMYKYLISLGADVIYYLPNRLIEGYGINNQALDYIKSQGTNLVITVDCGVTAVEEAKYAKQIGMDMCITDHHECSDILPDCVCIINPKQKDDTFKFKMHAGVGVAFKCISALSKKYDLPKESYLKYLDIVAIGTISDIVPLVDENRIISKYGLEMLKETKNVGLKALLKIVNFKEIDSLMVSFGIAPRINACGRMGNAELAVKLLLEEDEKTALEIAKKLDSLNVERQTVEKNIFDEAINMITNNNLDKNSGIVLYNENWHNGVIGIVASRLVSMYYKPIILLTKEQGVIRGSGRCQIGFSLYDSLCECKDYIEQFGGHELAAGLTISEEKLDDFVLKFDEVVNKRTDGEVLQIIDIDMQIYRKDLNKNLLMDIYNLKPYGQSNKFPVFLYKNLKVIAIRTLKEYKHLKLTLKDDMVLIEAIAFSQGNRRDEIKIGDIIDVVCNVEINTYSTPKTVQLVIQDFKKSI